MNSSKNISSDSAVNGEKFEGRRHLVAFDY